MALGGTAPPLYPQHYAAAQGFAPAFTAPPMLQQPPPPETVYTGTVTNFGSFRSHTNATHRYGFIRVDHTTNKIFVSEQDAPDGYLSPGDRCEFRIVDTKSQNRRTGARQWKAEDVVVMQRVPGVLVPDASTVTFMAVKRETVGREILALVDAHDGEMKMTALTLNYRLRYGRLLDYKALGFGSLATLVASVPGIAHEDRGGGNDIIRRCTNAVTTEREAPEPPGERSDAAKREELKAREHALIAREEALAEREAVAKREADAHDFRKTHECETAAAARWRRFVASTSPAAQEPCVTETLRRLSLEREQEPGREETKAEPAPAGYEVVARVLVHLGESRLLPTFLAQQIDDDALPYLEPSDMLELGVAPMICLAILGASAAGGKWKKLETEDVMHDVATHQSILVEELRGHRAKLERLRISRDELSEDLCCSITYELMKDPYICVGDSHTFATCRRRGRRGGRRGTTGGGAAGEGRE